MARIDDLLHVDNATKQRATEESAVSQRCGSIDSFALRNQVCSGPIPIQLNSCGPSLLTGRRAFCSAVRKPPKKSNNASLEVALDKKLGRLNF